MAWVPQGKGEGKGDTARYFIPNLPQMASDDDLRQHFSQYGTVVKAAVARDKATGLSRGFGYFEMADAASQLQLLQDSHIIGGQAVSVMINKDSLAGFTSNKVHLGQLPLDLPAEAIREVFSLFGIVLDVHLPKDPRTGERKNFGFVTFGTAEAAAAVLSSGQIPIGPHVVTVSPAAQSRNDVTREAPGGSWKGGGGSWTSGGGGGGGDAWGPYGKGAFGAGCGGGAGGQDWASWQGAGCGWGGKGGDAWSCGGKGGKGCEAWSGGGKGCDPWPSQGNPGMNGKGGDGGASSRKQPEGTRYFLPGLPEGVSEYELREHFSKYGAVVDVAIAKEKGSDKSRGFGYVTMQDASTREAIISAAHEFGGVPITVMLTKDSLSGTDVKKVHLSKLGPDVTADDIRAVFSQFGIILDVHTPKDPNTGERKNFAFVTFASQDSFDLAIAARCAIIRDQEVNIKPASQCKDGQGVGGTWETPPGGQGGDSWNCWGGGGAGGGCWVPAGGGCGGGCPPAGGCGGCGGAGPGWGKGDAWFGASGSDSWGPVAEGGCWGGGGKGGGCKGANGQAPGGKGQHSASPNGDNGGVNYFIAGLPEWVTDDELTKYFSAYGQVLTATVVKERFTHKSRGFGYMSMADAAGQEMLLNTKHQFGDQTVTVMMNKESLTGGNVKKVHLGNLNADVPAEAIRSVFSQFGVILDVHTPKDPATGERRNYGFVSFSSEEAFTAAITAGQAVIGNCEVTIRPAAQSRNDSSSGGGGGGSWEASGGGGKGGCGGEWTWGAPAGKGKAWSGWDGSWQDPNWGACGGWGGKGGGGGGGGAGGGGGGGMWDGMGFGEAAWGFDGKGCAFGKGGKWGCAGNDWGCKGFGKVGPY